ncbi:hypothetical protein [Rhizobium sp.]|jgi:hypothetical protein|uniref:DUF6916 family protein n=1 Tax=Rhizobium sp. TaxID=391 RepID=UPI000E887D69|nr:hypothetical protein [Rhizobium sp.]
MTFDLSTLNASMFQANIGADFQLVDGSGAEISVRLIECRENPKGAMPGAGRIPFSLSLEAQSETPPSFHWGHVSLLHPDQPGVGPVYATRILNPASPDRALYQIVLS